MRPLSLYFLQDMAGLVPYGVIPSHNNDAIDLDLEKFKVVVTEGDYSDYEFPIEDGNIIDENGVILATFERNDGDVMIHSVEEGSFDPVLEIIVKYQNDVKHYRGFV